jgi:amino acid permease
MLTIFRRFAYVVMASDQLVAISNAIKFHYDDGTTALSWPVGESVDNAVWISVFLILVIIINLFPVRVRTVAYIHMSDTALMVNTAFWRARILLWMFQARLHIVPHRADAHY